MIYKDLEAGWNPAVLSIEFSIEFIGTKNDISLSKVGIKNAISLLCQPVNVYICT